MARTQEAGNPSRNEDNLAKRLFDDFKSTAKLTDNWIPNAKRDFDNLLEKEKSHWRLFAVTIKARFQERKIKVTTP